MPKKPFTSDQDRAAARENGRKGGIASGQAKKEKKLIREIIEEYLSNPCETDLQKKLAMKAGISPRKPFIETITRLAVIGEMKKIDLDSLQKLTNLLGQDALSEALTDLTQAEDEVFGEKG